MTIINGVEIDNIDYKQNDIKHAIANNDPIEDKLNVIIVISNPCLYSKRYILLKEFVKRFEEEETRVRLFIVEMVYGNQRFIVTNKHDKTHLQLRTETPIWHKENMINLGVKHLLPPDYKAFAWIDADVEFENTNWATDTLKVLNGAKDVVQLFSHCVDMSKEKTAMTIFNSFGYCFTKQHKYSTKGLDYWHPGYAWAITRKAYERIGGLYDKGILGSGDNFMALSFIGKCQHVLNYAYTEDYKNSVLEYQVCSSKLRLGYVPGVIRHHYHGTKANRRYTERWCILIKHLFSPVLHLTYDQNGVLVPTENFPAEFKTDIFNYFVERKEDD